MVRQTRGSANGSFDERDGSAPARRGKFAEAVSAAVMLVGLLGIASWVSGCGRQDAGAGAKGVSTPASPSARVGEKPPPAGRRGAPPATADADGEPLGRPRRWSYRLVTADGSHVGYQSTSLQPRQVDGRRLLELEQEHELIVVRESDRTRQRSAIRSLETPTGELVEMTVTSGSADEPTITRGVVDGSALQLRMTTGDNVQQAEIPWSGGSIFASEVGMLRQPLRPGEERKVKLFVPLVNLPGELTLHAGDWESTELLSGSRKLLRVESTLAVRAARIRHTLWVDAQGVVWKTYEQQMQLTSYLTDDASARPADDARGFDLNRQVAVRVVGTLPRGAQTRRARYRVTAPEEVENPFASTPYQQVTRLPDGRLEIAVTAPRLPDRDQRAGKLPAAANAAGGSDRPTDHDRQGNNFIQSTDPAIVAMADQLEASGDSPRDLALAAERYVHQVIDRKDFSRAFATAAEVAETRQGDCTEHAVLLAAICRARGIPSRVVSGLVYHRGSFAFHMWNEVWLEDSWYPLDGTLGRGGIAAGHLKISHSHLSGVDPMAALLPVLQLLGGLEIEIVASS